MGSDKRPMIVIIMRNPNWFASVALLCWPLVALWLYSSRPVGRAIIWTILGGYLLLPAGASIKIEGIPPFDKVSIPTVAAFIGCLLVARDKVRLWNRFGLAEILILILLINPFITSMLNGDAIA